MANVTISDLTVATSITGSELLEIEQSGTTKSVTAAEIAALGGGGGGGEGNDANDNYAANNILFGYATHATAAGTTTLTVASPYQQYFTGSTTQTCRLPVASTLVLGHKFFIANASTGDVTVQSSGGSTVIVLDEDESAMVTCILASGASAASWSVVAAGSGGGGAGTVDTTGTPVADQVPVWTDEDTLKGMTAFTADTSGNVKSTNFVTGYATTATAAGTTTLTVGSAGQQFFTGSTTQTVKLPVASTLSLGHMFYIYNSSSGTITVQSSGGGNITTLDQDIAGLFTCISLSGTSPASWHGLTTETAGGATISDAAYDATTWNDDTTTAPSKNALRDKFETLTGGGNVSAIPTPISGQLGVWTGATTLQGSSAGSGVVSALAFSVNTAGGFATTTGTATLSGKTMATNANIFQVYTAKFSANHSIDSLTEAYGGVIYVDAAATMTLPAVNVGMSVTVITIGNVAVSVDPSGSEILVLDGVALTAGHKATNGSDAGDIIVLTYYAASTWYAASNNWTDGG